MTLGLKLDDADMFSREKILGDLFDYAHAHGADTSLLTNYIVSDIAGKREAGEVSDTWLFDAKNANRLAALITLITNKTLSSRGAKDTLGFMFTDDRDPETIAREKGLIQESDTGALAAIAQKVIDANPSVAADYKAGKAAAMQFLVGQGMKESKGSANPQALREAIQKILG